MKKIADLRGHTSRVLHLAISPDGTTVASAAADETLRFWKVFQQNNTVNGVVNSKPQTSCLMSNLNPPEPNDDLDYVMTDSAKFFQSSPSQFNGYSLR